ncbi:MAG: helix-turn-helix transcriptional regulator [Nitrospirae bacterium]|nr:helix-turn-helix transcriptional regulator [Candidatus Manganitrophaceae bacterium]
MTAKTRPLRSKIENEKEILKQSEQNETRLPNDRRKNDIGPPLPEIVYQLYAHFAKLVSLSDRLAEAALPTVNRICIYDSRVYLLRALLLRPQDESEDAAHFMILIEKVSQGVRVDQIDWTAKLTPRESEVVYLLLEGKTNKEIAVRIDIGEYTVKDHIKRVMKKLAVTTRAGIVAKVLQHHFPT